MFFRQLKQSNLLTVQVESGDRSYTCGQQYHNGRPISSSQHLDGCLEKKEINYSVDGQAIVRSYRETELSEKAEKGAMDGLIL
jgi:hypothetical protein